MHSTDYFKSAQYQIYFSIVLECPRKLSLSLSLLPERIYFALFSGLNDFSSNFTCHKKAILKGNTLCQCLVPFWIMHDGPINH